MAGDQVYRKGAQLLKRMVAPLVMDKEMEFRLVKPWVYSCVGRRARAVLDARVVEDAESLVRGLQDYLASEGDRVSGKTAVFGGEGPSFRKQAYHSEPEKERGIAGTAGGNNGFSMKCFRCGKVGHKAVDCWQGGAGRQEEVSSSKIVCYICGVEGHKATTCPGKKEAQKGANVKQVQQVRLTKEQDTVIQGKVNGWGASLVLDSGAHITIVPEDMVEERRKTGEYVVLRGFQAATSSTVPTAKVKFEVDGMAEWEETVALAPAEKGKETEVIFGLRLTSPRGLNLVALANGLGEAEVGVRGMTTKERDPGQKKNARVVEAEKPKMKLVKTDAVEVPVGKPVAVGVEAVKVVRKAMEAAKPKRRKGGVGLKPSSPAMEVASKQSTGAGELVADRPASNPKPVTQVAGATRSDSEEEEWPDWPSMADFGEVEIVTEGDQAKQKDRLKPVRALDVVVAEESRVKDLCIKKDDFVVELREKNENKREKKYDRVSAVLSSLSSKPAPSVACWTGEGLEAFTGRKVSCVDVCLPTLPTQDWDSRLGDPKQEAGGGTKERFGDPRQQEAEGGASEKPGGPWLMENGLEESVGDEVGLRPAPSYVVGGDVGSESPQKEGVATAGVALQRQNKEH